MTMNRSGLCRLVKPIASSSFGKHAFHDYLIGTCKEYVTHLEEPQPEPFSILSPSLWRGLDGSWKNPEASYQILGSGMILLNRYINIKGQVDIVNTIVRQAQGPGAFYKPRDQDGDRFGLRMTTFGRNWDPITRYENSCRSDEESEPPGIPPNFVHLAKTAIKVAQAYLDELPSMHPDVCVANFYPTYGRLGLHQDCDESSESLKKGLPVISVSVGDTAEFWYGHTRDVSKMSKVRLKSGDVLIFGGKSRLIYHQVKKIFKRTAPLELALDADIRAGRLNLTLKQV